MRRAVHLIHVGITRRMGWCSVCPSLKKAKVSLIFCFLIMVPMGDWRPVVMISTHPDNWVEDDYDPQIAVDADGDSYVVWVGDDPNSPWDSEIYWVKITAKGAVGAVQKISTHPNNVNSDDYNPQIAVDAAGNSYVVWVGIEANPPNDPDIYWVKITAAGVAGTVQKISTHPDNAARIDFSPQIAVDAAGNSYVTWSGEEGILPFDFEIYWVKITAAGVAGTVQKISTHANCVLGHDYPPQIAVDAAGNSYVAWCGDTAGPGNFWVYWVKIDAAGVPGAVQLLSTHTWNLFLWFLQNVQIAADNAGNSYVTWYAHDGNDFEIYWIKIDAAGVAGTVQLISTHPDNINYDGAFPQIAVESGNSYVVWNGCDGPDCLFNNGDGEVYWVKIDAKGVAGTVEKISTHPDNIDNHDYEPQIGVQSGNSYVVWYGDDGNDFEIYWVEIDYESVPREVQKISIHEDNRDNDDTYPQIAVKLDISHVAWYGFDGNDLEIYFIQGTPPFYATPMNSFPRRVIEQLRPLAYYHISVAEDLSREVDDLLSEAEEKGIDTSVCDSVKKAEELLAMAHHYFEGANHVPAIIHALQAQKAYEKAKECLLNLIG